MCFSDLTVLFFVSYSLSWKHELRESLSSRVNVSQCVADFPCHFWLHTTKHVQYCIECVLGLMRDDTIYEDTDVKEALRRLPENQYNERTFRIKRALDLSMKQQILPKDMWTKYEEVQYTNCWITLFLMWNNYFMLYCFSPVCMCFKNWEI